MKKTRASQSPARHAQAGLVKTIGERLRFARESICNLSQVEAAQRLGYSNSAKLSKIERATDTCSIPLWLIYRAAKVYMVSTDYLFGLTSDWDTGMRISQERETAEWVFDTWERQRKKDCQILKHLHDRQQTLSTSVAETLECSDRVHEAFLAFIEQNPKFADEMRGSARLYAAIKRANESSKNVRANFLRFKLENRIARAADNQPSLFEED